MTSLALEAARNPSILEGLSDEELLKLEYDWAFWARENQLEPEEFVSGIYNIWLVLSGRGFGKTRIGAETTNKRVKAGSAKNIGLIAASAADARDTMVLGQSGLVEVSPPWFRPVYHPSKRSVEWPNGAVAHLYSAEDPDQLRGPQHDWVWMDEIAAWARNNIQETWDNAMFGLRQGLAQAIVTSTPRPIEIIRDLNGRPNVYVTRGSTYENIMNLAPSFRDEVVRTYEGTRLGRQELYGEILTDNPDALWTSENLDLNRILREDMPVLKRKAVAVDPAGSRKGHEVGIVAGGIAFDGQGYLTKDASMNGTPNQWGTRVLEVYDEEECDIIVIENNFGGEMVTNTIRNLRPEAPIIEVRASRGKQIRAQPVSLLNERNLIHHVGYFPKLEDQLVTWLIEEGPNDRLDAYVWLWTHLMASQVKGRIWFL